MPTDEQYLQAMPNYSFPIDALAEVNRLSNGKEYSIVIAKFVKNAINCGVSFRSCAAFFLGGDLGRLVTLQDRKFIFIANDSSLEDREEALDTIIHECLHLFGEESTLNRNNLSPKITDGNAYNFEE